SRLTSLREIQDRYEGFQRGTRAVMQRADEIVDSRSDTAAIHGVVADVVRAPELLEVAVEAALGDRLGGGLVREPGGGLARIGSLKRRGGGRSAVVPLGEQVESLRTSDPGWRPSRAPTSASDVVPASAAAASTAGAAGATRPDDTGVARAEPA